MNSKIRKNYMNIGLANCAMLLIFTAVPLLSQTPSRDNPGDLKFGFVPGQKPGAALYRLNEVLVQYKSHVTAQSAAFSSKSLGGANFRALRHTPSNQGPIHLVTLSGQSVDAAIADIQKNPNVEYAQPNYIYRATVFPNDLSYGQLWGLNNSGQAIGGSIYGTGSGTAGKDINAETAWNTITDCSTAAGGPVVAVIDSGVNYNQEDLTANMVNGSYTCPGGTGTRGCDFVGAGDADPMDLNGHGTHVSATIGGRGNNLVGVSGVCQAASILAVRVLDAVGSGTTADIVEGVNFAAGTGAGQGNAKVVNMSLGGPSYDAAFNTALTTAETNGVVVVVAAGNATQDHNVTASYPCDYAQSNIICVAAADQDYGIASFSDFDTNATAANRKVDIAAPGVNILSSWNGTDSTTAIALNAGWSFIPNDATNNWAGYGSCANFGGVPALVTPWDLCTAVNGYYNNENSVVHKSFAVTATADAVTISLGMYFDLRAGDSIKVYYQSGSVNPVTAGTLLDSYTNISTNPNVVPFSYELQSCAGGPLTCSLGFQFISDASGAGVGVGVFDLNLNEKTLATNQYMVENGTSMASPHVAGIATMVKARNPNFTMADVVDAILTGGDLEAAFSANTKTGMVADAFGSLKYIPDTVGVSLTTP